jgi:acetoin utilization protein AcuA
VDLPPVRLALQAEIAFGILSAFSIILLALIRAWTGALMIEEETRDKRDKEERRSDESDEKRSGEQLPGKPPFAGFASVPSPKTGENEEEFKETPPKKNTRTLETAGGNVLIENYCAAEKLWQLTVDEGIRMFSRHNPERQRQALIKVAGLPEGNIVAGVTDSTLVSYIGIHHPSAGERWGKPAYHWLFELGAIEVSREYRELGLAELMLRVAFDDPFYDDKIMITTAFTWHWDLEGTGMDKAQYREMFVHLAGKFGFIEMGTDEPNVTMDYANLFLVRLGKNTSFSRYHKLASLLYTNEWEAMLRGF